MKQSYHVECSVSPYSHRFTTFPDDPPSGWRGHFYMCLQLHFFFCREEILFFQFPEYPSLGLKYKRKDSVHSTGLQESYKLNNIFVIIMYDSGILGLYCITLNWASGGPVMMTILWVTSGLSAGAIWTCIYTHSFCMPRYESTLFSDITCHKHRTNLALNNIPFISGVHHTATRGHCFQ